MCARRLQNREREREYRKKMGECNRRLQGKREGLTEEYKKKRESVRRHTERVCARRLQNRDGGDG